MAFCIGKHSKQLGQQAKKGGQSKSIAPIPRPSVLSSPIQLSQKQIKEMENRNYAAKQMYGLQSKRSFTIKTNVLQTRFSKKDIKDLKERFVKYSNWILVNSNGENINIDSQGQVEEQQQQHQTYQTQGDQERGSDANVMQFRAQSPNVQDKSISSSRVKNILKGNNFKKIDINMEESPENLGIHYIRKMSKFQFRECMGLLGLESNAFLSDRIFETVDSDKDSYITFPQFATIMDTLINGEEDEKHEFSFALLDIYETGYFNFEEFCEIISKIIAHWCIITGSQVKVDKENLKEIFQRLGPNKDGIVELDSYKKALKENPGLFQWFDLLNQGFNDGKKAKKDILEFKQKQVTDILTLQQKILQVVNQMQNIDLTVANHVPSSKQSSSQMSHFDSQCSNAKRDSFRMRERDSFKSNAQNSIKKGTYDDFQQLAEQTDLRYTFKLQSMKNDKQLMQVARQHKSPEIRESTIAKILDLHKNPQSLIYNQTLTATPITEDINSSLYNLNKFTFNPGNNIQNEQKDLDDWLVSPKKAYYVSDKQKPSSTNKRQSAAAQQKESIMEIKKCHDIQKQAKKENGEKRIKIEQQAKKVESDDDMIDDPDSPEIKSKKQRLREQFYQKQQRRTPSPFVKNGILKNSFVSDNPNTSRLDQREFLKSSFESNNSKMKPENQQSNQQMQSKVNQPSKAKSRNQMQQQLLYRKQQTQMISPNTNHFGISNIINGVDGVNEFSPQFTVDCARSDFTNAQGGGPAATTVVGNTTSQKPPLSDNSVVRRRGKGVKSFQLNEDRSRDGSESGKQGNHKKQELILQQLNEIQSLTNDLLKKLQEDQDSVLGDQLKDFIEQQKNQLMKQVADPNLQFMEEEEEIKEDSLVKDNGELRPLNQIQTFFKQRSRKRLIESQKKVTSHIHKPLSQSNKSFIHIGHDNWNLVLHMMLGIRQSVRNVQHEEVFELIDADFQRKYVYELVAKKTKNMRLFEFLDFSPRVFQLIRTMYGITPDAYLKSIGPENLIGNLLMGNISSLKEQCSTGKSGSFFYYTADSNFMLKTISCAEFHHLRDILKDYYDHLAMYPHSLITRFFGLHKIKYTKPLGNKVRIYFVIMANVFKTARDINVRYDLKGSSQGRKTKKNKDDYVDPTVALKDLDFKENGMWIKVDDDIGEALKQQMENDMRLFQKLNINDYSLLLGIHYLNNKNEAKQILDSSPNIHQIIEKSFHFNNEESKGSSGSGVLKRPSVQYSTAELLRPPIPFYECHDGGIVSKDGSCVYFIGIIDTLTYFGAKKKMEYHLKSVRYGNKTISCIPPKQYGERFIKYMRSIFDEPEREDKKKKK